MLWKKKQLKLRDNPFKSLPGCIWSSSQGHVLQVLCRKYLQRPKGTVLQRETFRTKPAEGVSTNAKFGLKYQVLTVFPIPPSCHISIVQIENKKLFCLEFSQIKPSEAYSSGKGRVEAFLHHGEEGKEEEEVFWGLASNHIQHNGFQKTSQRKDSLDKHGKLSPRRSHQGTVSTVTRSNSL